VTEARARVRHHFTVDVEEYFQVAALAPYVPRGTWEATPPRIDVGTRQLLDLLAHRGVKGTFFTLGWVAKHHPQLVRDIAAAGHEVASHGWGHEKITSLSPDEFRASIRDSKQALEALSGAPVLGYRAPSFSITRGLEWALEILVEEGYQYDSSLFPVRRAGYGFEGGQRDPHWLDTPAGPLYELPPATLKFGKRLYPAGGGAYFRLFPYEFVRAAFASAERRGVPGTFYIHPWELDPDQPVLKVPRLTKIRHYGGIGGTVPRLRRFLSRFDFQTISETLGVSEVTVQR
jgi:polysaccharide deacetylase family protein (PEP-CTERM system associated)